MIDPIPIRAPARSGTVGGIAVVLLTGIAALFGFGANYEMTAIDWVLAGLVAVLTLAGAIALARFIRAHPGEIGEARFDTTHRDAPGRASDSADLPEVAGQPRNPEHDGGEG